MKRGEQTTNFGQRVELIMHLYMDCNSFLVIVSCIIMQQYLVVQTSEALNYNRINNESIYKFNFQNIFGNTVGNGDIIIDNSMIPILLWVLLPALLPILWTILLQLPLLRADTASVHFNSRVPLLPVTSTHILDMTLGFVSPTLLANCKSNLYYQICYRKERIICQYIVIYFIPILAGRYATIYSSIVKNQVMYVCTFRMKNSFVSNFIICSIYLYIMVLPLLPVTSTHILDMTLGFVSPTLLAKCKSHTKFATGKNE